MKNKLLELTGQSNFQLENIDSRNTFLHKKVVAPFQQLKMECQKKGFYLSICSAWRSYDTQLSIWNNKALGKTQLLDEYSNILDFKKLNKRELLFSILNWSMIPGFSRHHWGTEIDIFDNNALPSNNYQIKLIDAEYNDNGIFGPISIYLDELIETKYIDWFRPYSTNQNGVRPERWHLSYKPISQSI